MLTGAVRRLEHHVYAPAKGVEVVKMAGIYGANGAGKSNMVKAMVFFHELITRGWASPAQFQYKLDAKMAGQPTSFEVEFVLESVTYLYGMDLTATFIAEEWLYKTFPTGKDEMIFHRYTDHGSTRMEMADAFTKSEEQQLRIKLYAEEFLKPTSLLLRILAESKADFGPVHRIFQWLEQNWLLLFPTSKVGGLIRFLVNKPDFFDFAQSLMCTFQTGIKALDIQTLPLEQFFNADEQNEIQETRALLAAPETNGKSLVIENSALGEEVLAVIEGGVPVVKQLIARHQGPGRISTPFRLSEESDGTRRLLDLVPAFYRAINEHALIVIDEIERAIHPLLLKTLIAKFANDHTTRGQLIFTTHEVHLLDQDYMRQDEFWFAKKSPAGETTYVPLSDFSVRFDLDLRKGYLNGRFGATPNTADLEGLNWKQDVSAGGGDVGVVGE